MIMHFVLKPCWHPRGIILRAGGGNLGGFPASPRPLLLQPLLCTQDPGGETPGGYTGGYPAGVAGGTPRVAWGIPLGYLWDTFGYPRGGHPGDTLDRVHKRERTRRGHKGTPPKIPPEKHICDRTQIPQTQLFAYDNAFCFEAVLAPQGYYS